MSDLDPETLTKLIATVQRDPEGPRRLAAARMLGICSPVDAQVLPETALILRLIRDEHGQFIAALCPGNSAEPFASFAGLDPTAIAQTLTNAALMVLTPLLTDPEYAHVLMGGEGGS